jgi:hypothetical protein
MESTKITGMRLLLAAFPGIRRRRRVGSECACRAEAKARAATDSARILLRKGGRARAGLATAPIPVQSSSRKASLP